MSRSTVHGANSNASLVALSSYTPSSWIHSFSVPDGIVDLLVAIQYTYSIYILLYVYLYKISMYADLISRWCSPDEFLTPWRRKFGVFPSQWGRSSFSGHFSKAMETSVWMNLPSWCNHRSWSHSLRESVFLSWFFFGLSWGWLKSHQACDHQRW